MLCSFIEQRVCCVDSVGKSMASLRLGNDPVYSKSDFVRDRNLFNKMSGKFHELLDVSYEKTDIPKYGQLLRQNMCSKSILWEITSSKSGGNAAHLAFLKTTSCSGMIALLVNYLEEMKQFDNEDTSKLMKKRDRHDHSPADYLCEVADDYIKHVKKGGNPYDHPFSLALEALALLDVDCWIHILDSSRNPRRVISKMKLVTEDSGISNCDCAIKLYNDLYCSNTGGEKCTSFKGKDEITRLNFDMTKFVNSFSNKSLIFGECYSKSNLKRSCSRMGAEFRLPLNNFLDCNISPISFPKDHPEKKLKYNGYKYTSSKVVEERRKVISKRKYDTTPLKAMSCLKRLKLEMDWQDQEEEEEAAKTPPSHSASNESSNKPAPLKEEMNSAEPRPEETVVNCCKTIVCSTPRGKCKVLKDMKKSTIFDSEEQEFFFRKCAESNLEDAKNNASSSFPPFIVNYWEMCKMRRTFFSEECPREYSAKICYSYYGLLLSLPRNSHAGKCLFPLTVTRELVMPVIMVASEKIQNFCSLSEKSPESKVFSALMTIIPELTLLYSVGTMDCRFHRESLVRYIGKICSIACNLRDIFKKDLDYSVHCRSILTYEHILVPMLYLVIGDNGKLNGIPLLALGMELLGEKELFDMYSCGGCDSVSDDVPFIRVSDGKGVKEMLLAQNQWGLKKCMNDMPQLNELITNSFLEGNCHHRLLNSLPVDVIHEILLLCIQHGKDLLPKKCGENAKCVSRIYLKKDQFTCHGCSALLLHRREERTDCKLLWEISKAFSFAEKLKSRKTGDLQVLLSEVAGSVLSELMVVAGMLSGSIDEECHSSHEKVNLLMEFACNLNRCEGSGPLSREAANVQLEMIYRITGECATEDGHLWLVMYVIFDYFRKRITSNAGMSCLDCEQVKETHPAFLNDDYRYSCSFLEKCSLLIFQKFTEMSMSAWKNPKYTSCMKTAVNAAFRDCMSKNSCSEICCNLVREAGPDLFTREEHIEFTTDILNSSRMNGNSVRLMKDVGLCKCGDVTLSCLYEKEKYDC